MNYTSGQRQYNNRLTEQLLELAAACNYTFDPKDFNFVAVRDRIRCYYKSYVQSSKKRREARETIRGGGAAFAAAAAAAKRAKEDASAAVIEAAADPGLSFSRVGDRATGEENRVGEGGDAWG